MKKCNQRAKSSFFYKSYLQKFCFVGLLTQSDDMSNSTLIPTRKQTNATNLDGKIIKSLKKQEEKRDKRAARKKEVNFFFVFTFFKCIY